jgi:hypothetical protein
VVLNTLPYSATFLTFFFVTWPSLHRQLITVIIKNSMLGETPHPDRHWFMSHKFDAVLSVFLRFFEDRNPKLILMIDDQSPFFFTSPENVVKFAYWSNLNNFPRNSRTHLNTKPSTVNPLNFEQIWVLKNNLCT